MDSRAWTRVAPVAEEDKEATPPTTTGPPENSDVMLEGDLVMIYLGMDKVSYAFLDRCGSFENKYGIFRHSQFIGQPFGSKISAARGWVLALAPTPELWARALPHRTQIVQSLDSANVAFELGLTDGSVVLEAGTGSGAATVAFARACAPSGRVYSVEFNASRVEKARTDFCAMGLLDSLVDVRHGDVCAPEEDLLPGVSFDAVFLDVPEPWHAMDFVRKRAKPQARVAAYSPCLEQVQKTCAALRDVLHADDIVTVEARLREFELNEVEFQPFLLEDEKAPDATKTDHQDDEPARKRPRLLLDGTSSSSSSSTALPQQKGPLLCARPAAVMRGHTAFLTFATLPPADDDEVCEERARSCSSSL